MLWELDWSFHGQATGLTPQNNSKNMRKFGPWIGYTYSPHSVSVIIFVRPSLSVYLYVLTQFSNSCFKKRMWKTCDLSFFVALIICWKQPTNWRRHFFFFSLFFLGCPLVSLPYNIYLLPSTPHKNTIWPLTSQNGAFHPWPGVWGDCQKADPQTQRAQPQMRGPCGVWAHHTRHEVWR